MTWTLETSQGFESDKIAAFAVPYLQGKCLDIGCGMRKVWPGLIGIDNGHHFGVKSASDIDGDGKDLSLFADESVDGIFSSHCLEHVPRGEVPTVLAEWTRVLKAGGHLVLYVPSANFYPKMGEPGANPDHKWDIYPGDIERILDTATFGYWTQLECEERSETNEYSLFLVFRKDRVPGPQDKPRPRMAVDVWQRNPNGQKRALICRFGAVGDQIIASSILPGLKGQGYHITYMCTPDAAAIVQHDPHIDAFWTQAKDFVPNAQLGSYWDTVRQRFDLFINLSESIEGGLLALPGRLTHGYSEEARRRLFGTVSYLERTHDIAGLPHEFAPKFYPTEAELRQAHALKRAWGGPVLVWALHGSAMHKTYPWTQIVCKWLLDRSPFRIVFLSDAGVGKDLQDGLCDILRKNGADMDRIKPMGGGKWSIRQALAYCQAADVVVGPETGPLNAVCMEPMPKIIYLSHSSPRNLTDHWVNTTVLTPDIAKAPCYPCHRLHYSFEHCHEDGDTHAALCAASIAPERVFEAIVRAVDNRIAA